MADGPFPRDYGAFCLDEQIDPGVADLVAVHFDSTRIDVEIDVTLNKHAQYSGVVDT